MTDTQRDLATEILDAVNQVVRDVFVRDDIVLTTLSTSRDVDGWDSFRHIDILLSLEVRFELRFSSREVDVMETVGDLVQAIARRQT